MDCSDFSLVFKALADETRLKIVKALKDGELCGCKLLSYVNITQPTLSYHMKMLIDSGLVKGRRDGAWIRYSLNNEMLGLLSVFFISIKEAPKREEYKDCNKICKKFDVN